MKHMKYLKYIIFALIIAIIIVLIILIYIFRTADHNFFETIDEIEEPVQITSQVTNLEGLYEYFIVKDIIEDYYYDLAGFNLTQDDILSFGEDEDEALSEETIENEKKLFKNRVYNCLSPEYKKKNNVTLDNIQEKLGNYNDVQVLINDIYYVDANESIKIYFVYGNAIEKETLQKNEFAIMLSLDGANKAFEIYPSGYGYNVELGKELKVNAEEIKNVKYNSYEFELINDETYTRELFNDYKNRLTYDVESAYDHLDEEYKTKKFENLDEFKIYVENNYYKFMNANLQSYKTEYIDDYERLVFADRNNNGYIFKVKAIANYSVILDSYTIDIPEFTSKYDEANTQEKVILNINKFMLALNDKDYKYAYNILANSFKSNNFRTQEEFENYVKSNFFEENKFDYEEYGNESGTYYTYQVKITDATGASNKAITKTFIMLLGEERDFELSFNV